MIIRIVLLIFLLCSTSSFAQEEDVCDGVESATITTNGNFTLCWKRNNPNDNVHHYKVFDNPTEIDPYSPIFGEEVYYMLDSDCLTIHCITEPIPAMQEPGVHYLTVRGFDNVTHHSGPSNSIVLTVTFTITVLPAENLAVEVLSQ